MKIEQKENNEYSPNNIQTSDVSLFLYRRLGEWQVSRAQERLMKCCWVEFGVMREVYHVCGRDRLFCTIGLFPNFGMCISVILGRPGVQRIDFNLNPIFKYGFQLNPVFFKVSN